MPKHRLFLGGDLTINEERNLAGSEIENIIAQVKGVSSARVVYENGTIVEIHVLADGSRSPKQVVRDIESAVMVKLGITVDHKCISVAQLTTDEVILPTNETRLRLIRIGYTLNGAESSVSITISVNDELFEASSTGPKINHNRLCLAARATLAAVERYLGTENMFVLFDTTKITVANQQAVITVISFYRDSREEILLGAALAKGDDLEAAAKATMDAINRRLVFVEGFKN